MRKLLAVLFLVAARLSAQQSFADPMQNQAVRLDGGDSVPSGTVTSVSATFPSEFTLSGIPITGAGTIGVTWAGASAPSANDTLLVSISNAWTAMALTNCTGAGKAVTYATASHTFGCNTIAGGGSVATDAIFTTKGDLPVGTGASTAARLGVGADNTVLTAASGQATGQIWQTVGTLSITDTAVTYAKIQDAITGGGGGFLGRSSGTGVVGVVGVDGSSIGWSAGSVAVRPWFGANASGTTATGSCRDDVISELVTLSTIALFTDSTTNLLPANSIIKAVTARVTTTITTSTGWSLGDNVPTANRFTANNTTLVAGTTDIGFNMWQGNVTTAAAGPVQTAAAKVRITLATSNPGAGVVRVVVYYMVCSAPTS